VVSTPAYDIVVPSIGRESLPRLLDSLQRARARPASLVVAVDEERRGPASARNRGASSGTADWLVFLDDDVVVTPQWAQRLHDDLVHAAPTVGAVQGRVVVPRATHRAPTDWERNTIALETARWITADMAVRRRAFEAIGGFDEAFPRAYREDSDLVLRLQRAGWSAVLGHRVVEHPVRPARFWASVGAQRGNADDQLLKARHGRDVLDRVGAPPSSLPAYVVTTATMLATACSLALAQPRRRPVASHLCRLSLATWAVRTVAFAWRRIEPGPRDRGEVARMTVTSAVIPPVAVAHSVIGWFRYRRPVLRQADA
jgi:cellulose synthase/poly-beta-1,6-N-acetylglucosamine synthase-like glycosyltransferase